MEDKNSQTSSQTSIRFPHPSGLLRLAMRSPILLYRLRLGWLLGKRFLLLEHRGRKSGVIRQTVIEVVDHDPQVGYFVVAAAWGNKSDWFKNISVHPKVAIEVGLEGSPPSPGRSQSMKQVIISMCMPGNIRLLLNNSVQSL